MGISDGLQGGSGEEVDCSVGTIVWVRRRNGSWWPGRILGSDELSASHLMSPRSGTPVKLLGREDASVDWYNLEKSKRVKAFRCGEFDDCIERAECSQGIPIKKREKYARREDAILHALELERELLEKKQQKLGSASCVSSKLPLKKEVGIPKGNLDHCRFLNLKSQTLLKGLDSSEEESMGNPLYARYNEHGKELSLADDKCESIPRMKGLQDLGLRAGSSKRKMSASVDSEGPKKSFAVDNNVYAFPNGSRSAGAADHVSNTKNSLALKRKRTQGGLVEESLIKKRDRRRPLLQVLQSSAKLSTSNSLQPDGDLISLSMKGDREQKGVSYPAKRSQCVYLPGASSDCLDLPLDQARGVPSQLEIDNCRLQPDFLMEDSTFSGSKEVAESDSSERDYLNLDMDEETAVFSDSSPVLTGAVPSNPGRFVNNHMVQGQQGSMSSEELDESAVTGHTPNLHPHAQTATGASDVGVSKWQLKGKRNIRNLMKRSLEMDGNSSNGFLKGSLLDGKGNIINQRNLGHGFYHGSEDLGYYDDDDLMEKAATETQMLRLGNKRYRSMLKSSFRDHNGSNTDVIDPEEDLVWDEDGLSQAALKGYWDESAESFNPIYVGHRPVNRKDSLVDVDLKVQTSYQGEHVPLVSLMSRLNGKAIIGHPIQIETLEDGFSDHLLPVSVDFGELPTDYDGNTALTPVWRTARRTVMHRVPRPHPRPHPSKALEGDDVVGHSQYSDLDYKPTYKKLYSRQMKRPPTEKKCPKKLLKRTSLSNQKTRTLSSIAIEQKLNGRNLKPAHQKNLDGLIKSEIGPTTVACIPVKLAFSRLLEAVGKPPSRTLIHSVSANGDTEKRPS